MKTKTQFEHIVSSKGVVGHVEMCKCQKFIQIGVTALRDPGTGEFLPAVPLYIEATAETAAAEAAFHKDVSGVLAKRMQAYIDANGGLESFFPY